MENNIGLQTSYSYRKVKLVLIPSTGLKDKNGKGVLSIWCYKMYKEDTFEVYMKKKNMANPYVIGGNASYAYT